MSEQRIQQATPEKNIGFFERIGKNPRRELKEIIREIGRTLDGTFIHGFPEVEEHERMQRERNAQVVAEDVKRRQREQAERQARRH